MNTQNSSPLSIVTHNGTFHADEVLATALLISKFHPGRLTLLKEVSLVRTRDTTLLEAAKRDPGTYVLDVGGEYYPGSRNFDHHQPQFEGPLATAGLIWDYINKSLESGYFINEDFISSIVEEVDFIDNGEKPEGSLLVRLPYKGLEKYSWNELVSFFNPQWNEEINDYSEFTEDYYFNQAVEFFLHILQGNYSEASMMASERIKEVKAAREAAKATMEEALASSVNGVVILPHYIPWQDYVKGTEAVFIIYPRKESTWMVQCVPPDDNWQSQKVPLPEAWAGLRDAEFSAVSGLDDGVFCHKGRFMAIFKSQTSAMAVARLMVMMSNGIKE